MKTYIIQPTDALFFEKHFILQLVEEWRKKSDDMAAELDAAQREARNLSTDLFKMKTSHEEMMETVEGLKRENKALSNEIKDLTDQLGEGGRSAHDMQKVIRRLEIEKEELQHALDEAEGFILLLLFVRERKSHNDHRICFTVHYL